MDWKILHKYLQGSCNEEELRTLGVWLQEDPANEDFFTSFVEEWDEDKNIEFDADVRAEWEKFRKNNLKSAAGTEQITNSPDVISRAAKKPFPSINKKRRRDLRYWSYSAAAVMLLVLALVFVIRHFNATVASSQEEVITYQEINTVRGQRTNLKLSDGSKVTLNSSSSLRIPKNYGKETRTLYLEGEAFFEVEHDEENPFIVISHQTYTKDLGTQFNVSAYDSTHVEVAVKEGLVSMGKVKEGNPQKEIVEITPNKLGTLKSVGGLTVSDIEHMDQYTGWTEGKLTFKSTPFPDVVKRLERWFDIDCRVEGSASGLSERTLTATYDNMPMSEVLKVLSISMDISYDRQGRTIIFYGDRNILNNSNKVETNQTGDKI